MGYWESVIFIFLAFAVTLRFIKIGFLPILGFLIGAPMLSYFAHFMIGMPLWQLVDYLITGQLWEGDLASKLFNPHILSWASLVVYFIACRNLYSEVEHLKSIGQECSGTDLYVGGSLVNYR